MDWNLIRCSIDRVVILVRVPGFKRDKEGQFVSESRQRDAKVEAFDRAVCHAGQGVLDPSFRCRDTALYLFHRRSIGGVDFQYIPKFPCKEKLTIEELEALGRRYDGETLDRGYVYEYFDNDFILRIEFNPNKQGLFEVSRLLRAIRSVVGDWRSDIRINRIDVAVDYPFELDLALVSVDRMQKECGFWTRDKFNGLYFGSMSSSIRFRFYDKALERKREGVIIPAPYYRAELEYKESHFMHESQPKIADAFRRIRFHGGGLRHPDDPWVELILFKAAHVGLTNALSGFDRRTRSSYLGKIAELDLKLLPHPSDILQAQYLVVVSVVYNQIKEAFGYEIA